jgi:hypothetical protein
MFEVGFDFSWVTTVLRAFLLVVTTITFFAVFDNLVSTEGTIVFLKAVFLPLSVEHSSQHRADVPDGTG